MRTNVQPLHGTGINGLDAFLTAHPKSEKDRSGVSIAAPVTVWFPISDGCCPALKKHAAFNACLAHLAHWLCGTVTVTVFVEVLFLLSLHVIVIV